MGSYLNTYPECIIIFLY